MLRNLGLPVPHLLTENTSLSKYGFSFMVLDKIAGRDLRYELPPMTDTQMDILATQIVGFQRQVMTLPEGDGYGYTPIGERAKYMTWPEMLIGQLNDPGGDPYCLTLKGKITMAIKRAEVELLQVLPSCFLDDLTTKNVIILDGRLEGVIDFDVVCYGDPLWWIALTSVAIVADIGLDKRVYAERLCRKWGVSERQHVLLALYEALHSLNFLIQLGG